MRPKLLVCVGLVALLCTLSPAEDVNEPDEDDVEIDSENEPEDKVRNGKYYFWLLQICRYRWLYSIFTVLQGKEKKKAAETEAYQPPEIALEHEDSVFLAEPFAKRQEFESRY